jgi:hypothetical protein
LSLRPPIALYSTKHIELKHSLIFGQFNRPRRTNYHASRRHAARFDGQQVSRAAVGGLMRHFATPATISCKIVKRRATVDEDGHYSFAVAL